MLNKNILRHLITIAAIVLFNCCKKPNVVEESKPKPQLMFRKVVILGNSITLAPVNPFIGWNESRGMAASVLDSDYVHRLTARLKKIEPTAEVTVKFFNDFESDYVNYDFEKLKALKESKPDLIIVRVGENINRALLDGAAFQKSYQNLVTYLTKDDKQLVVLSVGPLWLVPEIDNAMQLYTPYASLSTISFDASNLALGLFENPGVAQHPGDKGMRIISDIIWNKMVEINPYKKP